MSASLATPSSSSAPGEMMFAPRGTPHSIKSVGSETDRELIISLPGGVFDAFIEEVTRHACGGRKRRLAGRLP